MSDLGNNNDVVEAMESDERKHALDSTLGKREVNQNSGENKEKSQASKIKEFEEKISLIETEQESLKKDRDAIKVDRDGIKADRESIKEERDALSLDRERLDLKYKSLRSKLLEHIECPVCLEVPTSGPVHVCPNGHFVCSKCKDAKCPTCRSKMFSGKSLLAVTVIENIEHNCLYEGCEKLFLLDNFKNHLKTCPHNPHNRAVLCPAPKRLCGQNMELSKLYSHMLKNCLGSWNRKGSVNALNNGKFPKFMKYPAGNVPNQTISGIALHLNDDVYFYLTVEHLPAYTVFSVQHLGSALECQRYLVNIAVHQPNDPNMKGVHIHKFSGEPLPIDMKQDEKHQYGLLVGAKQMEKIVGKAEDGGSIVGLTIDITAK